MIEKKFFAWIDAEHRALLVLPPSIITPKQKKIATTMDIADDKFKASWG